MFTLARRRHRDEGSVTLEAVIGIALAAVVFTGVAGSVVNGNITQRTSTNQSIASETAQSFLETAKSTAWASVGTSSTPDPSVLPAGLTAVTGGTLPATSQRTVHGLPMTLTDSVAWEKAPVGGSEYGIKIVTVKVSWQDNSSNRTGTVNPSITQTARITPGVGEAVPASVRGATESDPSSTAAPPTPIGAQGPTGPQMTFNYLSNDGSVFIVQYTNVANTSHLEVCNQSTAPTSWTNYTCSTSANTQSNTPLTPVITGSKIQRPALPAGPGTGNRYVILQDDATGSRQIVLSYNLTPKTEFVPASTSPFTDVPTTEMYYKEIDWVYTTGISTGYSDGTYRPSNYTTRDATSAFFYRLQQHIQAFNYTAPAVSPYNDITPTTQFYKEMCWLGQSGYTPGWSPSYGPLTNVTRSDMAVIMFRMYGWSDYAPPATSPFTDVPTTDPHYKEIAWLASENITTGYPDGTFQPTANILRDAMSAFYYRYDHRFNG